MAKNANRPLEFYDKNKNPIPDFNKHLRSWLSSAARYKRSVPKAFDKLLALYRSTVQIAVAVAGDDTAHRWAAHRLALNRLTDVMFGVDLGPELAARLTTEAINKTGFRTTLAQGVAKNTGEAYINLIAYALADSLAFQDEVVVEKGLPPKLRSRLTLVRDVDLGDSVVKKAIDIPIEVDLCVYKRSDPTDAVLISAKTRLKEVFHIAVMWKLFFDFIDDEYCRTRWGLRLKEPSAKPVTQNMVYAFATADMVRKTGRKTQGPDVERDVVRNLIQMDASFMDYVFVSKADIAHVSKQLVVGGKREAMFHELGCLLDLIEQKFNLQIRR